MRYKRCLPACLLGCKIQKICRLQMEGQNLAVGGNDFRSLSCTQMVDKVDETFGHLSEAMWDQMCDLHR